MEYLENPGLQVMEENHVLSPQLSAVPNLEQSVLTGSSSGSVTVKNETRPAEQDSVTNAPACTSGVAENKSVISHSHDTEVSKLSSEAASVSSSENKTSSKMSEELIDSKNGHFGDGHCEESGNNDIVDSDKIFPSKPAKVVHLEKQENNIVNVKLLEDKANVKNLTVTNGSETSTYSCLENEKSTEMSQGSVSLNAASVVNGCSQGLQSNKEMDICENLASVSEKEILENQKNLSYTVHLMMDKSKHEEHASEMQGITLTGNMKQALEGTMPSMEHKMTDPSFAQSKLLPAEQDSVTNAPACASGVDENKSVVSHSHDTEVSKLSSEAASVSSSENKTSSKMSEQLIDSKDGHFGDGYCQESGNIDSVDSDKIFPSKPVKVVHLENQQNEIVNLKLLEDKANVKNLTVTNGSGTSTYSCLENEKPEELSRGSVSLIAASVVNECSQGLQSNKEMDICENLTSLSEKENLENQKSHIYSVNLMMDISKNEEHATETQVPTLTGNVEQTLEGTMSSMEHKVTNPSFAQSTGKLPDSDTTNDVYVMENIDKVLDVLCEENPEKKENVEQGNSSSSEYSSDSDDESSSSESSTSSDSSSSEDLENIRKEIEKEEEKLQAGPPKTKSEVLIKELPEVPDLDINLENDTQLVKLGQVFSIVEMLVVVKAFPQTPALDTDSILFLENRSCLGLVFETFGPVQTPFYSVRFNKESDINDKGVCRGDKVFYAPDIMEYSHYVFVTQLKKLKGSDASWEHDEEPPQELIEYSDDEEEAKAKASKRKERMAKSGSSETASSVKVDDAGTPLQQGTRKGSRKRSWQNQAKAHPVDQKQNAVVIQRGPPPRPGSGPRFTAQAVGRPFMDHFTSGAQQFGIRPMAPPGGGPAGRFSLRGPPSGGPLDTVPPHTRQFQGRPPEGSSFQGNYPVGQPSGFTLRHRLPPRQGFSGLLSRGPCFHGPWQVSAPSGFSSQHPMPQGFPEPSFQGQNYMGMHPPPHGSHNL